MSCYEMQKAAELAEAGWSQDEIELLEKEVELAKQKAKAASYASGDTLIQQEKRVRAAEKAAQKKAHDEFHAKLDAMMKEINHLVAARMKVPV